MGQDYPYNPSHAKTIRNKKIDELTDEVIIYLKCEDLSEQKYRIFVERLSEDVWSYGDRYTLEDIVEHIVHKLVFSFLFHRYPVGLFVNPEPVLKEKQRNLEEAVSQRWPEIWPWILPDILPGVEENLSPLATEELKAFRKKKPKELANEIKDFFEQKEQWKALFGFNRTQWKDYFLKKKFWSTRYAHLDKAIAHSWKRFAAVKLALSELLEVEEKVYDHILNILFEWARENGRTELTHKEITMTLDAKKLLDLSKTPRRFRSVLYYDIDEMLNPTSPSGPFRNGPWPRSTRGRRGKT